MDDDPDEVVDALEAEEAEVEVLAAVEVQETALGRLVTPEILQKLCAKSVAFSWSEVSQSPARQHAMSLRKVGLEQMHLISRDGHPPILPPVVNLLTQDCCTAKGE
jgi:hypothetical protein